MAPRKPAMYRAVFFDLDDTIFDFGQCSRQAFFQACRCCHWSSSEEAFTEFQRLDQMLWSQQKAGHLTVEQVIHRRAESMARWFGHPEQGLAFQQRFSQCLAEEAALEPHARETLSLLHKKVPLYGASNGILAIQQARLEKANLTTYFSGLFVSDKIGAEKPDPRFFTFCLQRSGFPAEGVLMVGDSLTADIAGAFSVGMDGCWYHPHTAPPPANTILPHAITDLRQLLTGPFVWGSP